jgi:hypothetical protein
MASTAIRETRGEGIDSGNALYLSGEISLMPQKRHCFDQRLTCTIFRHETLHADSTSSLNLFGLRESMAPLQRSMPISPKM